MKPAICLLSVVPMRKEPAHRSEMVSQLLFGETVIILEEKDDFVLVKCSYDRYEGWVQASQLTHLDEKTKFQTSHFTNGLITSVVARESSLHVPFGTPVFQPEQLSFEVNGYPYRYLCQPQQVWNSNGFRFSEIALKAVYTPYLNTPYLWGGKSVFGITAGV
jgi:gamma-D-glutamyl-L-lysine dipeptidyl-peptidase